MYKVVECFSGIGSQIQALKNIGIDHQVVATVEWDINSICAYDVMHNDCFDLSGYNEMSKEQLVLELQKYKLSSNGKTQMSVKSLKQLSVEALKRICLSIERNNNFVNIGDVVADKLPQNIDLLTYSFPCQDLSICGFWHGNTTGINRKACNRSGLLWEIERILYEMEERNIELPKMLLMENVSNILSNIHKNDFSEWTSYLSSIGYYNHIYKLNSLDFGIPQNRERVYMISILCDKKQHTILEEYFKRNSLESKDYVSKLVEKRELIDFLRIDYKNQKYKMEADISQPNFTPSRRRIYRESKKIYENKEIREKSITTITTKQDRFPNSGLIEYHNEGFDKAPYRNLTGRECFLLMGFEENQFDKLLKYNFNTNEKNIFFTNSKFIKMAGNSIVVQVIEQIFKQIFEVDKMLKRQEILESKQAV